MKISTRGRYALRMMIYIAGKGDGATVTLREISESQEISMKYLEQLVAPLVAAGLITGHRGARGGYSLKRPAAEISAGDIIRASESSIAPVACLEEGFGRCPRAGACETIDFWKGLENVIATYIDSVSLEQLCAEATQRKAVCDFSATVAAELLSDHSVALGCEIRRESA